METNDLVSVTLRHAEDPKSESNDRSDDDDKLTEEFKKEKLEDLKRKAFYSVLLAFRAETLTIGNVRKTQSSSLFSVFLTRFLKRLCFSEEDSSHRETDEGVEHCSRNSHLF